MQQAQAAGAARLPQPPALPPGARLLNRYVIEGYIGGGGFGHIYRAHDLMFGYRRAIKEAFYRDPGAQQQFQLEAEFLVNARHPNLVRGYSVFHAGGKLYLVMDYVDGKTLEDIAIERIRRTGRTPTEAQVIDWILPICGAVETLHTQPRPIIHRDIKPANIKLSETLGIPILIDLGLAKLFAQGQRTLGAALAFTPGYAPPEQYQAMGATDQRTDVYGMGATLYFLLTGYQPTEAPARLSAHALAAPRALNPALSKASEAIVLRAMELDPALRYQSMHDLAADLRACRLALEQPTLVPLRAPDRSAGQTRPTPVLAPDGSTRGAAQHLLAPQPDDSANGAMPVDTAARLAAANAAADAMRRPGANPLYDAGATDALRARDNATNPIPAAPVAAPNTPAAPAMPPTPDGSGVVRGALDANGVVSAPVPPNTPPGAAQLAGVYPAHVPHQPLPQARPAYPAYPGYPARPPSPPQPGAAAPYRARQPYPDQRPAQAVARRWPHIAPGQALVGQPASAREAYGSVAGFLAVVCLTLSFVAPFARPMLLFLAPALLLAGWSVYQLRTIRETAREFRWLAISALALGGVWLVVWLLLWIR